LAFSKAAKNEKKWGNDMNDMDGHSFKVWRWEKMETWRGV